MTALATAPAPLAPALLTPEHFDHGYPGYPVYARRRPAPATADLCAVPGCAVACWSMGLDAPDTTPCPHGWASRPAAVASTPVPSMGDHQS
ncbi:hypothetical protein AB8O64_30115 [Streptomyces sp. QH1-20]|uniref:hypothetical protein n=1 Tax=Streptomyces sp. QH1-20 TaxID=3240934 RepID=UPI003513E4B3